MSVIHDDEEGFPKGLEEFSIKEELGDPAGSDEHHRPGSSLSGVESPSSSSTGGGGTSGTGGGGGGTVCGSGGVVGVGSNSGGDSVKWGYSCSECDKRFASPGKLRQHGYSHSGETPFECLQQDCDKKFTSRFKLKRHVLIHSQDKQFHCAVCNRPFRRKDHLKNHEKVHSACKTVYTCSHRGCTRNYNSYTSYRKHQAMHSAEEGALDCKICHRELLNREALMNHLKIHYGSRSVKSSEEKKFPCDQCERRFFTRKDLKRHSVVHTGDREFPCPHCAQRFGRKDHMVRHAKKTHPLEYGVVPAAATANNTTSTIAAASSAAAKVSSAPALPVVIKKEPRENEEILRVPFVEPVRSTAIKTEPAIPYVETTVTGGSEINASQVPSFAPAQDLYSKFLVPPRASSSSTVCSSSSPPESIAKKSPKKSPPSYSPPGTVGFSPVPSPGLAHILEINDSSSEQDLDTFISELVSESDLSLLRPTSNYSVTPRVKLEEPSSSSASSTGAPSKRISDPGASAATSRFPRLRNPSSDSVTHTKNPVLPSIYADNALIVPEPSKTKYPSSFQIDSEDSLSDLRALLPDQVFNQL